MLFYPANYMPQYKAVDTAPTRRYREGTVTLTEPKLSGREAVSTWTRNKARMTCLEVGGDALMHRYSSEVAWHVNGRKDHIGCSYRNVSRTRQKLTRRKELRNSFGYETANVTKDKANLHRSSFWKGKKSLLLFYFQCKPNIRSGTCLQWTKITYFLYG